MNRRPLGPVLEDAFQEGTDAFLLGTDRRTNPYPLGTHERHAWSRGFRAASQADEEPQDLVF